MNKEDITVLAQLLSSLKDGLNELERAQKTRDLEMLNKAKKEILMLKGQIDKKL